MKLKIVSQFENERVEESYEAALTELPGGFRISYREPAAETLPETLCVFSFSGGKAVLRKDGAVKTEMIFFPGEKTDASYQTAFGTMDFSLSTKELSAKRDGKGMNVRLSYELFSGNEKISACQMEMELR